MNARWGTAGIVALKAALCLGILFLVWRRLRLFSDGWAGPLLATAAVYAGGGDLWSDRSELVSIFLLSLLLLTLDAAARGRGPRRALWAWPPLFCLWANAHGFFAIGLLVVALWTLASFPRDGLRRGAERGAWAVSCAAATLVNPYGWRLHAAIFRLSASMAGSPIREMAPTPASSVLFWGAALILWLSFFVRPFRRESWPAAAISAAFTYFGARHVRGAPVFMVAAFPYVLANLSGTSLAESAFGRLRRRERTALACALLLAVGWGAAQARACGLGVDFARSFYAADACDFIARAGLRGPFYNDYPFGSYWIWRFRGDPGAFIDGRFTNVDGYDEVFREIGAAQRSPELWSEFLDRRGIQAALVRYPFASTSAEPPLFGRYFPRDRWALVYWDDLGMVFARRSPENAETIGREEFKEIQPDATAAYFSESIRREPARKDGLRRELEREERAFPGGRRARAFLALLDES